MPYQRIKPYNLLTPFVESIWIQEDRMDASKMKYKPTRILPVAKVDLIFNYGDPFIEIRDNKYREVPRFSFCGHRTRPVDVMAAGRTGLIIFSLYPWGAAPFLDFNMNEGADTSIDLYDIFNSGEMRMLEEKLNSGLTLKAKVNGIQDFLLAKMKVCRCDFIVNEIVNLINSSSGKIPINKIAAGFKISRRNLDRKFERVIGLNPKHLARIIRFQKALYYKKYGLSWAMICGKCSYYDQSHFIKEFREFTGKSPEKVSFSSESRLQNYFNSGRSVSHFYNTVYI